MKRERRSMNIDSKPLAGLRVIDLSRILAGPFAGMILADLGADVIKIEEPTCGDDSRGFGPFKDGFSAYFISVNRGKRSVTLNLKEKRGKEILKELVKKADILVENFRPGTMKRLGLDYETLKQVNPRLIYAACSGFGQSGPLATNGAYDLIIQAMGGMMSITGERGGVPTKVGASIADLTAALYTVIGILTALHARKQTGQGQMVDVAMLDCLICFLENAIARYVVANEIPGPVGSRHASITPFQAYPTKDNYIVIAIGNERLWERFCKAIKRTDLLKDERFEVNVKRNENYDILNPILEEIFRSRTTEEWMKLLEKEGIPCGPINTVDKLIDHPQIVAREMIAEIDHGSLGKIRMPALPIKLSATPGKVHKPAPRLGEHTEEVLVGLLGMRRDEVAALRQRIVI
jgi:CoA:oxalate CoA-transferase